ncbi:MAG: NADH-quinone oxidoreductase subunit M [Acidobacteriota bacterium]|jgi:NADH-quinone oxidoreductase subunit M
MILIWLIVILLAGGLLAWASGRISHAWPRWISLGAVALDLVLSAWLWIQSYSGHLHGATGRWMTQVDLSWIPQFGIRFHLAMDGLSLLMLVLTFFLGIASVVCSWTEITDRVGFFHFNLMWILAGVVGVFLAMDLFLFYFFWELMLIPMYFLISIWGHENRIYAAVKFFLFTQASGLLMLLSILGLYFVHYHQTGVLTFEYSKLLGTALTPLTGMLLMLGFFIAFAVKLPMFPFHPWLPDAHTEAPTAGSVILAGLLLKTGAYGLIRFVLPLFPDAAHRFAPIAMLLAVIGILYGAILAFAQTDLKRLVAYTSVSHLGFVLLGIFAFNQIAQQGAVMEMICHGLSTGGLFILVGALQERLHTRDLRKMGGLWKALPRMGGVGMVLAMASLGLPGLGNFIGEFLVLIGSYQASVTLTVFATIGLVAASIYSLWIVQKSFHGSGMEDTRVRDFRVRDMAVMGAMIAALVWLGLYPQPVLKTAAPALEAAMNPVALADAKVPGAAKRQEAAALMERVSTGTAKRNDGGEL